MAEKHGSLTINSENIFPIIKKWMYSDQDIFFRELVSNGSDAITKLRQLALMGDYTQPDDIEYKIEVKVSSKNKTIRFIDNGLGMTADEVDKYINQIAFSGAKEFLDKFKDKGGADQIIGHFGLGFYSAFMVADRVTIDTKSWEKDSAPVLWSCDGGTDFMMTDSSRTETGTTITLFLNDESVKYANYYTAEEILHKYCEFMPNPIYLTDEDLGQQTEDIPEEEITEKDTVIKKFTKPAVTEEKKKDDGTTETVEKEPEKKMATIVKRPVMLNDTHPLWTKSPSTCTKEEYISFYQKVFNDYREPLFWIHLNMDYPFTLKGILYFPKLNPHIDKLEGTIKLYNNQVFVADNIKEVIPEYLMLLKGVIDCPDLPLNVSRSALQNDGFVQKVSGYITKKVAEKLTGMFKTQRDDYNKYWNDINPFIKYGVMRDEKFYDRMKDALIFRNLNGKYMTLKECIDENKEKHPNTIYYYTDEKEQSQYINMFKNSGIDAVCLDQSIDSPYISFLESKNKDLHFMRLDAQVSEAFRDSSVKEEDLKADTDSLTKIFRDALKNDKLNVKVEKLTDPSVSALIALDEQDHRMQEMMKMYAAYGESMPFTGKEQETLVLNAGNDLVQHILKAPDSEDTPVLCRQLYDLARLSHGTLEPDEMTEFIRRSNDILRRLAK
ncbi:MAG: molecular chaperone HtpG [Lachnospiraceae bacterium]|nr:molecular chaperone HtpG [Lachnospiraceae bacterium]MCH4030350.1 molecular chaperone HtpG [Lachnospiraceae bacterium]MCH4069562.1 molecular chaperone HtpG [Lachnospiraceae bacterium]MCH4107502.1 molecular chaperone HtpG [Lachnospiraceae bacterium]MCI1301647.1 molecular chaperone HtpG [Lachnospiraceae bacterium]